MSNRMLELLHFVDSATISKMKDKNVNFKPQNHSNKILQTNYLHSHAWLVSVWIFIFI